MEYPKTLYVNEREKDYVHDNKQLVGSGHLSSMILEGRETEVAVYQLVGVETYKKTTKVESVVEKISKPKCICAQGVTKCLVHGNQPAERGICPMCKKHFLGYCAEGEYCTSDDCGYVA